MSDTTIGERIAEIGGAVPPEAWAHLKTERAQIGPGYRLSVNVLDNGRIRLAVYDRGMNFVAGYEGMGTSDREGTNVLLTAVRPPD